MIDDALAMNVTLPGGQVERWGPDELNAANVPGDLTLSDTMPGGHATLASSLLRRIDADYPDERLFSDVHVYGTRGHTAWRGRMAQFPRTHGEGFGVSPGAVGHSAHLRDDASYTDIIVDRDPSHWIPEPLDRRLQLAGSFDIATMSSIIDAGGITIAVPGGVAVPTSSVKEVFYDAGPGQTIDVFGYQASEAGNLTNFETRQMFSSDSPTASSTGHTLTVNNTVQSVSLTTDRRWIRVRLAMGTGTTQPASGSTLTFSKVAVYGTTGITTRDVSGDLDGVYASDVIARILDQAAPLLTYTTGAGGSIEPTSFAIPHLAYRDPVTAEYAISDVNKYHLFDWGVYDDRQFFFRQPDPTRLLWEARLSDGAYLDADGLTAEQVINGVFVQYTDATGEAKTVGPPGGNFDDTDTALADTSSSNPFNAQYGSATRKWVPLSLTFPTTLAGAVQIGAAYLLERSLATRRGTVTLTGSATHPTEGKVPCWRPRAGDWISLKDLNGATVPRKIINKTYTHSSRQVRLDLDNTPAKLDAVLARVGVLAGIATGGGF